MSTVQKNINQWGGTDFDMLMHVRLSSQDTGVPASRKLRFSYQGTTYNYRADYDNGKGYHWPVWSAYNHSVRWTAMYNQSADQWFLSCGTS